MMNHEKHIISKIRLIKEALEDLNKISTKTHQTLFVIDENYSVIGTITDGDIRRGLINGNKINDPVTNIMNSNFKFLEDNSKKSELLENLKKTDLKLIPVLDSQKKLLKIIDVSLESKTLPIEAFIMAGGKGERLLPLTENTPKPLLFVGDKPIIQHNIDRLLKSGINQFYISIGYLGNQIVDYFKNQNTKTLRLKFIKEDKPLGTIGSVSMVDYLKKDTILVMNSDLLTNFDITDMFEKFCKQEADLMVATIPHRVNVPYAVLETNNRRVISLKEKPTYTFQSNAGIYLIKKEILKFIPKNKLYDATDLLHKMIGMNKKVLNYPILSYWLDIGKHEDYNKAKEDIKHIVF